MKKKNIIFFLIIFLLISALIIFLKYSKKKSISDIEQEVLEEPYKSNIMENVSYSSKDTKGNEYIVNASKGEIDYDRPNIIYLTDVIAFIKLTNSNGVTITSDFGKYNTNNFDTIFSKNVMINYLENKITGEYLDFSITRNSMIISITSAFRIFSRFV